MNGVLNSKRDPRAEKVRDFRKSRRHTCGPQCKQCNPSKHYRALVKARRRVLKAVS